MKLMTDETLAGETSVLDPEDADGLVDVILAAHAARPPDAILKRLKGCTESDGAW